MLKGDLDKYNLNFVVDEFDRGESDERHNTDRIKANLSEDCCFTPETPP